MKQKHKILILYAYLFRNIKEGCNKRVVNIKEAIILMKKVIHTAPRYLYEEILRELQDMELIRIINTRRIIIKNNKISKKQLKRLKEYIFPLSP